MVAAVPLVIGFGIIAAAQGVGMMYAGRFLTGFGAGAYTVITTVYVAEIAESKLRNTLGMVMVVFLCCGVVFV